MKQDFILTPSNPVYNRISRARQTVIMNLLESSDMQRSRDHFVAAPNGDISSNSSPLINGQSFIHSFLVWDSGLQLDTEKQAAANFSPCPVNSVLFAHRLSVLYIELR
jgi:hypothetical protein